MTLKRTVGSDMRGPIGQQHHVFGKFIRHEVPGVHLGGINLVWQKIKYFAPSVHVTGAAKLMKIRVKELTKSLTVTPRLWLMKLALKGTQDWEKRFG